MLKSQTSQLSEEIIQVMGDLSENINEEKFSEMDGELVCNACGAMFDPAEVEIY